MISITSVWNEVERVWALAEHCGICAYSIKENGKATWCTFHDEAVTEQNVCDDFLDYLDSPLVSENLDMLKKSSAEKQSGSIQSRRRKIRNRARVKDFFAWIVTVFFIALGIFVFLYF